MAIKKTFVMEISEVLYIYVSLYKKKMQKYTLLKNLPTRIFKVGYL